MTLTAEQLSPALIRPLEATKPAGTPTHVHLEPAFLTDGQRERCAERRDEAEEIKTYFAHAIVRRPTNLRLHVERIILYAKTQDPAILGAVCDLFLALQDNGLALRRRMLALARPLLSGIDYQILRHRLEDIEGDSSPLQSLSPGAMLSRGVTGCTRLVLKQTTTEEAEEDPLESARQQLEYGQTELAQKTLEKAVLANPGRRALHLALLEIYQHTRDRQPAERIWQALQGQQNPARSEWQRLLAQLDKEARAP